MASTNTQFSIAVHVMAGLGVRMGEEVTSGELATSVNAAPSFVRRVMAKLSKAGLVRSTPGKSGFSALAKRPEKINLLEIFRAVDAPKPFAIHDYPTRKDCGVSCGIKNSLESVLERTTKAAEKSLRETTLAEVIANLRK